MRKLITIWGVMGIVLLVGRALYRLSPIAYEPIEQGILTHFHWAVMIAWCIFNLYAEGYRGFHLRFAPRTVARAIYLSEHPTPLRVLLGPLYCMGLFGATRKVLITAWAVTLMVVGLVILIKTIDQPWRGIIDAGVVVGLFAGLGSLVWFLLIAIADKTKIDFDPGIPEQEKLKS